MRRNKQDLSDGGAALEIAMGVGPSREREALGDAHAQPPGAYPAEEHLGARDAIFARAQDVPQVSARERERTVHQHPGIDGLRISAGHAVEDDVAAGPRRRQTRVERRADRIVDHVEVAFALPPVVAERAIRSGLEHGRAFRFGGGQPDDVCAAQLRDLHQQQTDAAGRSVHQHPLAGAHRVRVVRQEVRGQALQQQRRGRLERDVVGQWDQLLVRNRDQFGVRIRTIRERDPFAGRDDRAGRFVAGDMRRRAGQMIVAAPPIDVGEVQADRAGAHERFAVGRSRIGERAEPQDLGSAEPFEGERVHRTGSVSAVRTRCRCN